MPLYTLSNTAIAAVPTTSFSAVGLQERGDLQRLLKEHIAIVSPETLVIAEEFGAWDASYRRIDLLGVSRDGSLVVIELKRDDTGAHMELQALRYAAMVARMTFDQAVNAYHSYLSRQPSVVASAQADRRTAATDGRAPGTSREEGRAKLLEFLGWDEPDEAAFAQDVRIVLVAADFSRELTTSVMWLNERDLDIRCVQLRPYQLGDQLLMQVEQVIPIREASEYQVQVREKARQERAGTGGGGADWTRYDLTVGGATLTRLYKRRLVYHAVRHVIEQLDKTPEDIDKVVRHSRLWAWLDGEHTPESFRAGLAALGEDGGPRLDPRRFLTGDGELLHLQGRTYAFTNQWGLNTVPAMDALRAAFPEAEILYEASTDG